MDCVSFSTCHSDKLFSFKFYRFRTKQKPKRWIKSAYKHFSNRYTAVGHQCRRLSVRTNHNSPPEGLRQGCRRQSALCWILSFAAATLPAPLSWATCRDEHCAAQVKPDVHINPSWQCSHGIHALFKNQSHWLCASPCQQRSPNISIFPSVKLDALQMASWLLEAHPSTYGSSAIQPTWPLLSVLGHICQAQYVFPTEWWRSSG